MTAQAKGDRTGRDHLEARSRLKLRLAELPAVGSIMIIDDDARDADVLASSLRLLFGHQVTITQVRALRAIAKAIADTKPDVVFLDDRLAHGTSAEQSLQMLQAAGHRLPVVLISGLLTRGRLIELSRLGVADIIHKDDSNAVRLAEAVVKVLEWPAAPTASAPGKAP